MEKGNMKIEMKKSIKQWLINDFKHVPNGVLKRSEIVQYSPKGPKWKNVIQKFAKFSGILQ